MLSGENKQNTHMSVPTRKQLYIGSSQDNQVVLSEAPVEGVPNVHALVDSISRSRVDGGHCWFVTATVEN